MPGGVPELKGLSWFTGGPVGWYVLGMYLLAVGLAVYVLVDSSRQTRRARLGEIPEPVWSYSGFATVFLVCVVAVLLPFVPVAFAAVPALLTPFWLVAAVAYLLRVVFPKRTQPDMTDAAEGADATDMTDVDDVAPASGGIRADEDVEVPSHDEGSGDDAS